jgi:hypothetical protein
MSIRLEYGLFAPSEEHAVVVTKRFHSSPEAHL